MKKLIISTLILILSYISPTLVLAHPMDTSQLRMYTQIDSQNNPIPENKLVGNVTFNWLQFSAMTKRNDDPVNIYKDIAVLDKGYIDFIDKNITFTNNNDVCKKEISRIVVEDVETVIVDGIKYQMNVICEKPISSLKIENSAFKNEIVTQQNTIYLYKFDKEITEAKETILEYTENNNTNNVNEKTDTKTIVQRMTSFFKDITSVNATTPTYLTLLVVYLVGALHAFEGGHNKIILGSLVINKKVNFKQAIIYTIIFTLTHISDIIILSIGLVFIGRYIDIYSIFPNLRIFTLIALFILSFYWLAKELRHVYSHKNNLEHDHGHDHEHTHEGFEEKKSFKSQLTMAFISGLAPCITGWSIFMLLFSSGRTSLMIPGNIVFGLGVFTVLFTYTLTLMKAKNFLINKASWIGEYSTIISSSLILLTTAIQIINIVIT